MEKRLEQFENRGLPPEIEAPTDPSRKNLDAIRLNEMEIENGRLRHDLKKLRDSVANNNHGSNDQLKEMSDQFETLQEELDRRREECIQLRTVLANVSLDHESLTSFSKTGKF